MRILSLLEAGCVEAGAVHARASVFDGAVMDAFLDKMASLREMRSRWLTVDAYDEMNVAALLGHTAPAELPHASDCSDGKYAL